MTETLGNLSPEYVQAIGRVAANGATVEAIIGFSCGLLLGEDPDIGRAVVSGSPVRRQLEMFRALGNLLLQDDAKETLGEVVDKVGRAIDERNMVIHSTWFRDSESGLTGRLRFRVRRGTLQTDDQEISLEEVNAIADHLLGAGNVLINFLEATSLVTFDRKTDL